MRLNQRPFLIPLVFISFMNCCPCASAAEPQKSLVEIASIPVGASREETVQKMGSRFGVEMPKDHQKPDELFFSGGDFAGIKVAGWWFRFSTNKLYQVEINFEVPDAFVGLDVVSSLVGEKYGSATSSERSYSFPYNIPFRTLDAAKIKTHSRGEKQLSILYGNSLMVLSNVRCL